MKTMKGLKKMKAGHNSQKVFIILGDNVVKH